MKVLVDHKGNTYLVSGSDDVHTKYGVIKAEDLKKKAGSVVESHMKYKFNLIEPDFTDFIKKAKRGPQTMHLKDSAIIAAYAGLKSGSRVVDAGVGSGLNAMYFAHIVYPEKVVAYEVREDFTGIARENFERFGIENIEIKLEDIYNGPQEKNLDLVSLDVPEPWKAVENAVGCLRVGGFMSSYSPSIEQNKKFFDALEGCSSRFSAETIEVLIREWDMGVVRPHTRMLGHTGFITIARRLS